MGTPRLRKMLALEASERIVVVAPHPDDDVLGCGALMIAAARRGVCVDAVYVTDGSQSHPGSRRFGPAALAALRRDEAREGLRRMRVAPQHAHFLNVRDGSCEALNRAEGAALLERLRERFTALRPTLVLAPWLRDPHPDHRAVAAMVRDAVAASATPARLLYYPVWLAERGCLADVPDDAEADEVAFAYGAGVARSKRRAIGAHRSQVSALIDDDPGGFRLALHMLQRACTPPEIFFEKRCG